MPAEVPKFSNAHFRNIRENLLYFFDANLMHFFYGTPLAALCILARGRTD